MTPIESNPFQELYVTDSPDPKAFVQLFSHLPVHHALALFRPGNVVLKGTQGSGKSMLLNLFRPQIRLAYHKADAQLPIPQSLRAFLGAGINLTLSGALDIGQRPLRTGLEMDESTFPLYFADFLNYFIVRDLLHSVWVAENNPDAFGNLVTGSNLNQFAKELAREDCWFGGLAMCQNFEQLCLKIDERIAAFRSFHVFNIDRLPIEIERTKTAVGEPISRTAERMRLSGVIPEGTPVFIRIDQIERLYRSDQLRPGLGHQYRQIINKALGSRDSRVSYRIGTRRYAWEDDLRIFGTADQLEHIRDFRIIDLDEILRRKEDTKTWVFPDFAEDALVRRLRAAGYPTLPNQDSLKSVFGVTADASTLAQEYARNSSSARILRHERLPVDWRSFLDDLFASDPLSALLATAWTQQTGSGKRADDRLASPPPTKSQPWAKPYWRKERLRQAIMQVAARSVQRLKWAGKEQILMLSAGNISIFLSICHEIWDAFLRAERRKPREVQRDPVVDGIHPDIQAVGVRTASRYWYEKITEQPKGDDRQRFINILGADFRAWLLDDESMSYPGHNGFSLALDELNEHPELSRFLDEAVSYGDMYAVAHTTKERDRRPRKKWYLNPVLSDYFQIPESHAKEPKYVTVADLGGWLKRAEVAIAGLPNDVKPSPAKRKGVKNEPASLFDEPEGGE